MVNDFVARHGERQTLGRQSVRNWARHLPPEQFHVVLAVRELLYHLSGARVVHCESALPQEDYVDYDIADLSQQRTRLSEEMIFMKLYVELVRDELCERPIPIEVLDLLDFEDILKIREPLVDSGFCHRYDELTQAAVDMVRGGDHVGTTGIIEDIERLESIRSALSETFRSVLEDEVTRFAAKRRIGAGPLASTLTSVALGLASFVPGLGPAATALALTKDGRSLFFNLTKFTKQPRVLHEHLQTRERTIQAIAGRGLAQDAVMVDAVRMLTDALSSRLRL